MIKSKIQNPKSKINPKSQCQISKLKPCVLYVLVSCVYFVFCALSFIVLMNGCATITEGAKGLAGVSTKALEDARKFAIIKTFNYDYFTCYTKTLDILKLMGAYIYAQNIKKHMIAIYVSSQDTTPVGLFFKEIDASHTQVEVSSLSTYAKELIAKRVFSALEQSTSPQQK